MTAKMLTPSICQTIIYLSSKNGKKYCFPSQAKLLELLKTYYQVDISRRTLNRALKYLEGLGYFERRRRISKGADGRFHFKSTLYVIKKELFKMAHKFNMLISNMPYWKAIKKPAADSVPGAVNGNGYIRNGFKNGIRRIKEAITKA